MRLIDADALIGELQKDEEHFDKEAEDCRKNSRNYTDCYMQAMSSRADGIRDAIIEVYDAPTIDLVRCEECVWYDPPHIERRDGTRTDVDDDAPFVTMDVGINVGGKCYNWHVATCVAHNREDPEDMEDIVMFRKRTDYCSQGERKDEPQTMSDLIRREDAIKAIEKHCFFINNQCKYPSEGCVEVIEDAINVPSADRPQGEWIPCSERLPEDSGDYLVCPSDSVLEDYSDFSEVMIMPYDADCEAFGWWTERYHPISLGYLDSDFNEYEVLAWMPLPKPWKGENDADRSDDR